LDAKLGKGPPELIPGVVGGGCGPLNDATTTRIQTLPLDQLETLADHAT
jgi:hypothetical protein